jgi:hypothetical protein
MNAWVIGLDDFVLRMREVAARQAAEIDEQGRR